MSFLLLNALNDAAEYRRDRMDDCTRCETAGGLCADHVRDDMQARLYEAERDRLAVEMTGTGLARGQTDPGFFGWLEGTSASRRERYGVLADRANRRDT